MKTNYLLAAILASGAIGAIVSSRSMKTVLLVVCALISGYALLRQVI